MLRAGKNLEGRRERPFAAAQGDIVKRLRLMLIGPNSLRSYRSPGRMVGEKRKRRSMRHKLLPEEAHALAERGMFGIAQVWIARPEFCGEGTG
jgi:hypothetical protein